MKEGVPLNPLFAAVMSAVTSGRRTCPKCGKTHTVSPLKKKQAVPCKFCGSLIPASSEGKKS